MKLKLPAAWQIQLSFPLLQYQLSKLAIAIDKATADSEQSRALAASVLSEKKEAVRREVEKEQSAWLAKQEQVRMLALWLPLYQLVPIAWRFIGTGEGGGRSFGPCKRSPYS